MLSARWVAFVAMQAAAAFLLSRPIAAQTEQYEGARVVDVQYVPSSQPLDPRDLANAQPVKKGEPLHESDVATAIDRLFATGRYTDIRVEADPAPGGVVVRFVTTPRYFVGSVNVAGKVMNPPNKGQVAATAGLTLGQPFQQDDLTRAERRLNRLLTNNGFYEAKLTPEVDHDDQAQQALFTFRIKPGKRARYTEPIIHGDTKLPDKSIVRATGWQLRFIGWWRQVTDARTRGGLVGIHNLYQKKDRLAAKVDLEKLNFDPKKRRVQPVLNINAGPKISIKSIETKVSRRILKRYVPVYEEGSVDRDLLVEGARNLRDYFQSQGYYDVDVDFRQLPPENDQETIEYVIARGERYKVVKLDVTGNHYFTTDELRERMFIEPASLRLRHGRYSEAFRKKDIENIENLYKANGLRDAKVTIKVDKDYKGKPGDIAVTVNVDEGQQWFVDNLTIKGVTQIDVNGLENQLTSSSGQPYSDVNLASDRNYILTRYYNDGFPDATFRLVREQSSTPKHVNLTYIITEGERKYVRDVLVSGLRTTRPRVVNREITLKAGDPLSLSDMTAIQRKFYDMGIFARVDTAIQNPDGQTEYKYVLYDFEEANRYQVNIGVGAEIAQLGPTTSDIAAPTPNTGFSPRFSLDVSRLNFLGIGHTVSFRGTVSNLEQRASVSYLAPRFQNVEGRNITFTALYDYSNEIRTYSSRREEASVQISQQFTKAVTGLFRFSYRRVSVNNVAIPTLLVPTLLQPVRIGMLSANIAQDRRDNPTDAHRGIYSSADFGIATKYFGSQRSFGRLLIRNSTYHPIRKNWVIARQTEFGAILPFAIPAGLTEFSYVPLPEHFFGGGSGTNRGFAFNQAGPRDIGEPAGPGAPATAPTGFPLGGDGLFFNTVELRFPLLGDNIGGVLFHDMGNVFSSVSNISFRATQRNPEDFDYMVHAAGFGVRYKTPVGPIRVDLAYSINPPTFIGFKGTYAELLNCGPGGNPTSGACTPVKQTLSHFQFFFSIGQTF